MSLYGPLQVKEIRGHARKTFKAWWLMVYDPSTGAVSIWAYTGYNTRSPLLALSMHTISDKGSQMIAASKEKVDWKMVAED